MKSSWINAYELTIGSIDGYKARLKELLDWDKPVVKKEEDKRGEWTEWSRKVVALKTLIREKYPNMEITLNNKIKLGNKI